MNSTFPDLTAFFIIIPILGLVNSFPIPLINSILSLNSSQREQGEVVGINVSCLSIANAIGPAISSLLISLNYKIVFWITGILTLFTAWFAFRLRWKFSCDRTYE
ncbi:MAG: hypothetical protein BRC44_11980 [Cyanobacteria bacterium QS_4_48_99]|nr:MAG: hypothetical protein BRC44_11980 [Cyanobacteria bacterium QS_4_48_99]